MTIQTAAFDLLKEEGKPLSSRELARRALAHGMVTSHAKDPVESHAQSLEKNIRSGTYNSPELVFVYTVHGRMVGMPGWGREEAGTPVAGKTGQRVGASVPVLIPDRLVEQIKLAAQARIGATFEDTVSHLLRMGLEAAAPDIKTGILRQLDQLEQRPQQEENQKED